MDGNSIGARVAAVFRPTTTVKEQDVNGFKTPSRLMAGTITIVLLALFAASYIAPYLSFDWLNSDVKPDPALQQNLLMLLAISVAYYIGSSKGSAEANDTIRAQVATSPPPPAPVPPALQPAPIPPVPGTDGAPPLSVKIDDSTAVRVQETAPPAGGGAPP